MAKLTSEQAQQKHARRLKGAVEDIRIGVQAVTEAPGVGAAKAQAKMRANLIEAIDSGKWADRVSAVPLPDWKDAMLIKGVPRIAAGIDGAKEKVIEFFDQLFPYQDNLATQLDRMPDLTLEDSINRMTFYVREMANFKPK